MGLSSWQNLQKCLARHQQAISSAFQAVLRKVDIVEDKQRVLSNQLANLWQGHIEAGMAANLLASLGFSEPERCYQMIYALRHSARCRRLSQAARLRLDRFMVLLLQQLICVPETATVLLKVMQLLENIVGRSAYLALLTENPSALTELLHWFSHSVFITNLLVSHPFLLEVLLSDTVPWRVLSKTELARRLAEKLAVIKEFEAQEEALRQFKLTNWLYVARAEMRGEINAVSSGRFLAILASVVLEQVIYLACAQLTQRFEQMPQIKTHFAVIAYGKLGSQEMNYNSDLDLVFVHQLPAAEEWLVNRLTQKILHMLTTRLQSGVLYPVDTRLRPSGAAGLLVSHLSAFLAYQRNQAWTWEHQALMRARWLYGANTMRSTFSKLKRDVLGLQRDKTLLLQDILNMRAKMAQYLPKDESIKHIPGGLLDLEFSIQFLVLKNPNLQLYIYTNTLQLIKQLIKHNVLSTKDGKLLVTAYKAYHHQLHQSLLCGGLCEIPMDTDKIKQVLVTYLDLSL